MTLRKFGSLQLELLKDIPFPPVTVLKYSEFEEKYKEVIWDM